MGKFSLYVNTIRYLRLEQMWHQVKKKMGLPCPLIKGYKHHLSINKTKAIPVIRELDYDTEFLNRFCIDELMRNRITLLHTTEYLDFDSSWYFNNRSPLWNHNLHYFEYLFALAYEYEKTKEQKYINKIKDYISSWIKNNPIGSKNSAWECYPIAIRLPVWIDIYSIFRQEIEKDSIFREQFIRSILYQYEYLLNHLEKHLLANHYFEDCKALVIASIFFNDVKVTEIAIGRLLEQCSEQIFEDGMQYERSPMYEKILLEDLIRVEVAIESTGKTNDEIREYIKRMLDAAYSLEKGLDRLPLFNDCGKNITKSIKALTRACSNWFGIEPDYKDCFAESGFYIFDIGDKWKLLLDGGQPGPDYSPGHSHCEMMSFELFHEGKPILVNCGTYAYQCEQRSFFRSTEAHNTVKVASTEQSECWSNFRMARRARINDVKRNDDGIVFCITDYRGHKIRRSISFKENIIHVVDEAINERVTSYLHFARNINTDMIKIHKGDIIQYETPYAEEFGKQEKIQSLKISGNDRIVFTITI